MPPLPPVEELFSPFDEVITSPILTSSAPSLLRQLCATTHKQLHLEVTPSQALMELSEGWNNEETIEGWAREYQITCEPPPSDLKIRELKKKGGELGFDILGIQNVVGKCTFLHFLSIKNTLISNL